MKLFIAIMAIMATSTGVWAYDSQVSPTLPKQPGQHYQLNLANTKIQEFVIETMAIYKVGNIIYLYRILDIEYERELYQYKSMVWKKKIRNKTLDRMLANCRVWRNERIYCITHEMLAYLPIAKVFLGYLKVK